MDASNDTTIPVQINIAANAAPLTASDAAARRAGTSGQRILGRNSDTETSVSPFAATETRTAYRVGRSGDPDTATGRPFMELYATGKMIARFVPEKPESVDALKTVQKSMYKPWSKMRHGEIIDLHPAITITAPKGSGPRDEGRCVVRQAAFRDDLERDSDRRCRSIYACELLAVELGVTDTIAIVRQYITAPVVCDLDGAQSAIRLKAYRHERENDYWWQEDHNVDAAFDDLLNEMVAEDTDPTGWAGSQGDAEAEAKSDVVAWFGPKANTRAPWGAESSTVKNDSKPYSVKNHFRRELLMLRPDADPDAVAYVILSATVEASYEKIGLKATIDKLQEHLDYLKENSVAAPATTQITKEEWIKFLNINGWQNDEVVRVLNAWRARMSQKPIEKLSQWQGSLAEAEELVFAAMADDHADGSGEAYNDAQPATTPTTPASASNAVTPATDVPLPPQDATAGKGEPQTGHATVYPNYPESPVTCWPANDGSIIWKGIRFYVSYRIGGNWDMAVVLMDDFAAHRECIDPSCLVRPMQTAATGGSTAPRDEDAPPMDDDEPGEPQDVTEKREKGTAIARSVEGSKTTYTIWFNVGSGAETRFPLKISNPQGVKLLETSLRAAKHNPDKWENGKRYNSVHVNAAWVQGAEFAPGKHYKDWTRFEVVREVEEVPA